MKISSLEVYLKVLERLNKRYGHGDKARYKRILKQIGAIPVDDKRIRFVFEHKIYYWERNERLIIF